VTEIFISYSRRDKTFVEKFLKALNENGYPAEEIWVDWEDIPASSKWEDEIRKGVEASNSVIFVLSPEWAKSNECAKELQIAAEYNKRLFPIVCQNVDPKMIPATLASLNWIFFRETDDFNDALQKLFAAVKTDLEWVAQHTNLLRRANEWNAKARDQAYLLRGSELQVAESWLARASDDKQPRPSTLQSEYIYTSRQDDVRRQRRNMIWVSSGLVVSILLAIAAVVSGISALRQSQRALASHLAAQATNLIHSQPDLSLLLSLEANYIGDEMHESDPALIGSLVTTLNSSPKLGTFLRAHDSDVRAVAFSPDGHWLATTGNPSGSVGQVILWDMTSGENPSLAQKFTGGTQRFLAVAFSPDSKVFVAAGDDQKLFVWDPAQCCAAVHEWQMNGDVRALVFAKVRGREYVAIAAGSEITFWDYATGEMDAALTLKLPPPAEGVDILSLAASPAKGLLAAGDRAGNITVWDLRTHRIKIQRCSYGQVDTNAEGYCDSTNTEGAEIRGVAFNSEGTLLISGSTDNCAWLWDTANGQLLTKSVESDEGGHMNAVAGVAFNPQNDQEVATVSWDNTVRLWNVVEGSIWSLKRVDTLVGHSSSIWSVAYSPDGKTLATASSDKTVILWKVNQINQLGTPITQLEGEVWALAAAPDGSRLAAGDDAVNIRLWEFEGGQLKNPVSLSHPGGVLALAFSHDGKWLASAGYENTIRVWDLKTYKEAWQIEKAHADAIWSLMFSPDDTQLASASYDKTVKLWDTRSHQQTGKSLEHPIEMYVLTFNEDGTQLLAAGYDRTIYSWDVTNPASPSNPNLLTGHTAFVNSLAFDPIYPSLFASTSDDKTLVIWNVDKDEHTDPVLGLNESMEAVTFSPNGQWLASATNNNTVLLWELDSERCSEAWDKDTCQPNRLGMPLVGHAAQVQNVVFLSDTALVSSSADGQLILWNLDKSFWYQHACDIVKRPFSDSEYRQYIENRINLGLLNVFSWFLDLFGAKAPTLAEPACISH
jgi:WD40 repeat protein